MSDFVFNHIFNHIMKAETVNDTDAIIGALDDDEMYGMTEIQKQQLIIVANMQKQTLLQKVILDDTNTEVEVWKKAYYSMKELYDDAVQASEEFFGQTTPKT